MRFAAAILFLTILVATVSAVPGRTCCCSDRGTRQSSCCVAPVEDDGVEIGCGSSCMPGSARSSESVPIATRANPTDPDAAGDQPAAGTYVAFVAALYLPILETPSPPGRPAGRRLLSRIAVLRI